MLGYPYTKNLTRGRHINMLAEYKKKANIGVGLGFLLWIVLPICGAALLKSQQLPSYFRFLFPALLCGGIFLFIWGCTCYAKGKGYGRAIGLLGFLNLIGLLILLGLPDKHLISLPTIEDIEKAEIE